MAGFLNEVFDGGDSSAMGNSLHVGAEDQFDTDQTFTVSNSESFGFEDMNGTEHSYSNQQDVTLTVGVHAVLGVAADASQGAFTGDGFEE